jgi:hypothetical protein
MLRLAGSFGCPYPSPSRPVGLLGLPIVGALHRGLRDLIGSPLPNGYSPRSRKAENLRSAMPSRVGDCSRAACGVTVLIPYVTASAPASASSRI